MKKLALIALALLPIACTSDEAATTPDIVAENTAPAMAVEKIVHDVICGHNVESIGACGNYIDIDGKWLEIADPEAHGLGSMEWCSTTGDTAEAIGSIEGEKFVATYFKAIG
jgi:hypothetical protein